MTHTYALLEVSKDAFDEIVTKLRAAGYDHAIRESELRDGVVFAYEIDMHGIGLTTKAPDL